MKLVIVPMSIKEAKLFVGNFHRHNKPPSSGLFALGVSDGESLVGVAIVGRPIARLLADGYTAEVTRVCVIDSAPLGACSCLYSACWRAARAMGYRKLVTYTLQTESGASLRGAGWRVVASIDPTKSGWSRSGRAREWQSIYGQSKFRWEIVPS